MPPTNYQVATLVEAVLGAVYEDSDHNLLELRQVMERLGLGYPEMVVKGIRTVGPGQL